MDRGLRGRPERDEHIPYYGQYIELVADGDVVEILARQIGETERYFDGYSSAEAIWRPEPAEWSAVEVVGHLADCERVLMYRALRIARGDETPWENVEFDPYVANGGFRERVLGDVVAEFAAVRGATVALLRGLDAAAWGRRMPEAFTVRSVRAFAYTVAGHELHHLAGLRGQRESS